MDVSVDDPQPLPTEGDGLALLCRERLFLSAYLFIFLAIRALRASSSFFISETAPNEDSS
jgi:hypothetical protein